LALLGAFLEMPRGGRERVRQMMAHASYAVGFVTTLPYQQEFLLLQNRLEEGILLMDWPKTLSPVRTPYA